MIQADDIDDDFFTPASGTSLANIFGQPQVETVSENETLKYMPVKQSKSSTKFKDQKDTECVFASALLAYEWCNGTYAAKGKLGFALLKMLSTGLHNITLYDSNKKILSHATITSKLIITLKENVYFSYLDNFQKYWCLYSSEEDLKKLKKMFERLGATIQDPTVDKGFSKSELSHSVSSKLAPVSTTEVESDTEDALYNKNKMSILHRMANMGHSVLPSQLLVREKSSSSSSDTSEHDYKTNRNKQIKNITKRNTSEKTVTDNQALVEVKKKVDRTEHSIANMPLFTSVNGQFLPISNSNLITNSSSCSDNDFNYFISEQRVNNSELRININRVNDKVDQILCKISHTKDRENISDEFQFKVMQKLLTEYENKIKKYEELLKSNNSEKTDYIHQPKNQQGQINELKDIINLLECQINEKMSQISNMETEMQILQSKLNNEIAKDNSSIETLTKTIQNLNLELSCKKEEIMNLINKYENRNKNSEVSIDLKNSVKNIMNDTFQSISLNFENGENYTGETVKNIVASIIKKATIESLGSV